MEFLEAATWITISKIILIDILLAFTDRNDMIKKDKKPWQMETAEWRFYGNN